VLNADGYLNDCFLFAFEYLKILNISHESLESRLHHVAISVPELTEKT